MKRNLKSLCLMHGCCFFQNICGVEVVPLFIFMCVLNLCCSNGQVGTV